ncbi:MAG TPA: LuxR C-terminal-related transcriptional regulator [Methylocella sp.]|jgi:DNA-binding CsgD family transcriptional regulator|nr:LuxR C-terminal-related transcriptional regulator [Methylocella sp.]
MSGGKELSALIDLTYEAVLDSDLWSAVLIKLADAVGAAHVVMPSVDWRANIFATIAPRDDPDLVASYKEYWAFRDPLLWRATFRPVGEIYTLDSLMPREEFFATPVFNEWWRPAQYSLATAGTNLVAEDQFSALICISNAPGKDSLADEQLRLFEAVARHIGRAVRINRQLWKLDLANLAATERIEMLPEGAMLADASGRVVLANAVAKAMLDARDGIFLCDGRLAVAGSLDALQKLVASCAGRSAGIGGPGGELNVPRDLPQSPLHVTVAPLLSDIRLPDVPWIGFGSPVAIVTVTDRDRDRRRRQMNLRRRFDLTFKEAALAAEILKGDGRKAAARRCGISDASAKTHLTNIFEKTGTHRQAELVRCLLGAAETLLRPRLLP